MKVRFDLKYIIFGAIAIAMILGFCGREYIQKRRVAELRERIEALNEIVNLQQQQISETTARLNVTIAERESMAQYCKSVEAIVHENREVTNEVFESINTKEESRDWYQSRIPDDIYSILYERLHRNNKADGSNKD